MSRKANGNGNRVSDVDRLFECFKCGITPPSSALREKKRPKNKLRQEHSKVEFPSLSPPLAGQKESNSKDGHDLSADKPITVKGNRKSIQDRQFSPVVFYGTPCGVPPKRPLSLLRLLQEIRVDLSEQKKSDFRREVWATFPRQAEAMKFASGLALVRIFSYQDSFKGQRRFLVSTYEEFWKRYKSMDSTHRHHYEVIQEGSPCHLYFDLEFDKRVNVGKNGDEMVDLLISVILDALLEKYSIDGSQDWIVELDSSTEDKFSRHLIIRIPKAAFKDNLHAGAFVAEICSRIGCARQKDGKFEILFIKKDSSSSNISNQLFVDTAVYSRNRCFRLALSSKAGKTSILLPTGRFKCKDMSEEDMFMASLICKMDSDCEKLLLCNMELDCVKTLHFDTEVNLNSGTRDSVPQPFQFNACSTDMSTSYFVGKSPFPDLDIFIESVGSIGNVSGKIRCWYWLSEYGLIIYSMSRNRYCERIGRQHKSNHVMYVVDLRRGLYYQKCYDPDCRGYRSPLREVPLEYIPDPSVCLDSGNMIKYGESINNNTIDQSLYCDNNENNVESASKDLWWHEAIKVAEDIENKPKMLELSYEEMDDEDDNWWIAAESALTQVEMMSKVNSQISLSCTTHCV